MRVVDLVVVLCSRDDLHLARRFFFSSRSRHTSWPRDWSSDVCSSDLSDLIVTAVLEAHAPGQIYITKTVAQLPGRLVERDQPRVDRADENAPPARIVFATLRIHPCRNAARGDFGVVLRAVHFGIEYPALLAARRVERDDLIERSAQVQRALNEDWRRLKRGFPVQAGVGFQRARVI